MRCSLVSSTRSRAASTPGRRVERRELRHLPLEFLQHLAAHVAALGDGEDLEQRGDRRARRPRVGLGVVVHRLLVQEIEAQEVAHPLVERLLVDDHAGSRTPPRALRPRSHSCRYSASRALERHNRGWGHSPFPALAAGARTGACSMLFARPAGDIAACSSATCSRRSSTRPVLRTTSSASASRCARVACAFSDAWACSRVTPSRAHEPLDLQFLGHVHEQHAVDVVAAPALGQQRDHEHLVGPAGRHATAAPSPRGSPGAGSPRGAAGRRGRRRCARACGGGPGGPSASSTSAPNALDDLRRAPAGPARRPRARSGRCR